MKRSHADIVVDHWLKKHAKEMKGNAAHFRDKIKGKYRDNATVLAALLRYSNAFEAAAHVFETHVKKETGSKKTDEDTDGSEPKDTAIRH
jgi:hypothetical protein